jgi:uncharacterized phage protein (TIGR01671 family)
MQDRFKFRVWNNEHKMYIEDNCYPIGGDYSLSMTQHGYVEVIGLGDYQDYSDDIHSWGVVKNLEDYIGDCVVEQCTGLKDKNGKLIYEGDIVKLSSDRGVLCPVVWDNEETGFCVKYKEELYRFNPYKKYHLIEVIGNIHENADLLELKQDD